jgi:hypothetical protein
MLKLLIFLMPELSTELAGATSQAGFAEIDGIGSGAARTVFSRAEIIAQRATYQAARSENVFSNRCTNDCGRYAQLRIINCPIEGIFKEICMSRWTQ